MRILLNDRNSFSELYSAELNGDTLSGEIIIDTGCAFTAIALGSLLSEKEANARKLSDFHRYQNNRNSPKPIYGLGVNDDRRDPLRRNIKEVYKYSDSEVLSRKELGFIHKVKHLTVGGLDFGEQYVKIMYNRRGHSLLGMNVLRNYYCEIKSSVGGTYFYIHENSSKYSSIKEKLKILLGFNSSILPISKTESKVLGL